MANRTLLQIVIEFTKRTGIKVPNAVISSTDPQIMQVVGLLNEEIEDLSDGTPLQVMVKEFTFALTATEDQGAVETILGEPYRSILNNVLWNRTLQLPLFGPLTPEQWQAQKARNVTGLQNQYRIRGDHLILLPAPTAGHVLAGEFVRRYNVVPAAGTVPTKEFYTADSDFSIFPDQLLLAGLRWRWKREKGLPYAEDKARAFSMQGNYELKTGTKPVLSMGDGVEASAGHRLIFTPGSVLPTTYENSTYE